MIHYDAIYLAPHLDDVALSCGAQIYDRTAAGESVLIVTLMAGDPPLVSLSPFAQALHTRWKLNADAVAARREEDANACAVLGADYLHWNLLDCIYRQHPETGAYLYTSDADIFGDVHPGEQQLVHALAARLAELPSHRVMVAPLAIGNHVDHQLTRRAAAHCFGAALSYYEDYPYVRWEDVTARAIPATDTHWQVQVIPVSAEGVAARIAAIAAFVSQVSTFFNGRIDLETQIHAQINKSGGERIWQYHA
ncbi:MAG: PIG-L family deacetylase [Anaerolineales bacterium]|nr:PIG-L family deacetylase [Anaerolineales bacterium]